MLVRPYEASLLQRGIAADFFQHVLGSEVPAQCEHPPYHLEAVNQTIGRDAIELIRILNRRGPHGTLPSRDILLEVASASSEGRGIEQWMSPGERCRLLAAHADENQEIADRFGLGRLFSEPLPESDALWSPYPGLSAERSLTMLLDSLAPPRRNLLALCLEALRSWRRSL